MTIGGTFASAPTLVRHYHDNSLEFSPPRATDIYIDKIEVQFFFF